MNIDKMNEITEILENNLKKEIEKNPTKTIYFLREKVLEKAKKEKLIKNYYFTRSRSTKGLYFGSCVGFDSMFKVIL